MQGQYLLCYYPTINVYRIRSTVYHAPRPRDLILSSLSLRSLVNHDSRVSQIITFRFIDRQKGPKIKNNLLLKIKKLKKLSLSNTKILLNFTSYGGYLYGSCFTCNDFPNTIQYKYYVTLHRHPPTLTNFP